MLAWQQSSSQVCVLKPNLEKYLGVIGNRFKIRRFLLRFLGQAKNVTLFATRLRLVGYPNANYTYAWQQ
jgi:hypothetical protein